MSFQEPVTLHLFSLRLLPTEDSLQQQATPAAPEPVGSITEVPLAAPWTESLQVPTDAISTYKRSVNSLLLCSPHLEQLRHRPSFLLQSSLARSNMNPRQTRADQRQIYSSLLLRAAGTFTDQQAPSISTEVSYQLRSKALGSSLPSSRYPSGLEHSSCLTVHCDTASQFRVRVTLAIWGERRAPCSMST